MNGLKTLLAEELIPDTLTDLLPETLEGIKIKRLAERELEKIAPQTGYPELDRIIKGFIPGHLYTLTGETNVGKTSLACNFAVAVARQKKRVLYIALEPENTVIEYLASVYNDKCFQDLTPDDLSMEDISIDILGKEQVSSAEKMVDIINKLSRYDLVIIDHIGYFITSQTGWLQQQSNAIKQLVGVAKKKSCAVMIIAHLRKRGKNDKKNYVPSSDDISGSGAFKQDSTDVLIATRSPKSTEPDEIQFSNKGKLYVTKTKSGPNGAFELVFSDRKAKISTPDSSLNSDIDDATIQEIFGPITD